GAAPSRVPPSNRLALPLPRSALRSKSTLIGLHAPRVDCPPTRRRAPSISNTLAGLPPPDALMAVLTAPPEQRIEVPRKPRLTGAERRALERAVTLPSAAGARRFDWRAAALIAMVLFGTGALAAVALHHAVRIRPTSTEEVVGALAQNAPVVPELPRVERRVDMLVHGHVEPAAVIDREAAILAVEKIARDSAEPCGIPKGPAFTRVVVMFAPSGRAKGAAIVGGLGYTRPGRCLANALLLASVPEFLGSSTSIPVTVRLR
ncbi:MAG TPA: hypothetical protein VFB62_01505, partial [Polyangiaceae bacterium]|nr:hypothetical protein [Polyangiaceae bacterium]